MSKIIDISDYNNINNYSELVKSNLKAVIMKVSEGTTYTEKNWKIKYDNLKTKISIGFYHMLTSTSEPETQAQHFYDLIKDVPFQCVPMLDVEYESLVGIAEQYSQRFINKFKEISRMDLIIYSYRCFITDNFSDSFCNKYIFWIADYSAKTCPTLTECKQIIAWQYTEHCNDYSFITGDVDCSNLYNEEYLFISQILNTTPSMCNPILDLQKELNTQNFTDKHWNDVDEDGIAGELTLSACPTIRIGATGELTRWIQKRIGSVADGIFGEQTRLVLIHYQKFKGLNTDGVIGKDTWRRLLGMKVI